MGLKPTSATSSLKLLGCCVLDEGGELWILRSTKY